MSILTLAVRDKRCAEAIVPLYTMYDYMACGKCVRLLRLTTLFPSS